MKRRVAPFTGAWIEILVNPLKQGFFVSLPSRERGLKCRWRRLGATSGLSLPSRERGLKLVLRFAVAVPRPSLPSRERGLKFLLEIINLVAGASLPSRERGLKSYILPVPAFSPCVAPFTGAWIEMLP